MLQKILLAIVVIVAMFPGRILDNFFPNPTLLSLLSLTFLISNVLQWKGQGFEVFRLSKIFLSLMLFYGWGGVGFFFTGSLDTSYAPIVQYFGVMFLYLGLIIYVKDESELCGIVWVGLVCAGIHSLSVIYQVLPTGWFLDPDSGVSHFRNKNTYSSYILFFFPAAIYLSLYSVFNGLKYLARGFFVLLLVGFLFSGSRAGEGAVIVQLLAMGAYLLYKKDKNGLANLVVLTIVSTIIYSSTLVVLNKISSDVVVIQFLMMGLILLYLKGKLRVNYLMILILVSAIIFGATNFDFKKVSLELQPFSAGIEIKNSATESIITRFHYWGGAWGIIQDQWFTGTGPNTFSLAIPPYLSDVQDHGSIIFGLSFIMNPPHAHNLYLQTASDMGVIGIGLFLILIYFVFSKSYYIFRNNPRPVNEPIFYAVVSIGGYLLHNIFEFNWYPSEFLYTFTIIIFIIDFSGRKILSTSPGPEILYSRSFPVVVWGIILVGGALTLNYYFYLKTIKPDGVLLDEKAPTWEKDIDRAKIMCPRCADPFLVMGKGLLMKYYSTLNPVHITGAKQQFDIAIQNSPLDLQSIPYLAETLALQGRFQEAKENCYKLLNFQKYEFNARMKLAIILLVESFVAKNPLSGPRQIVEAWEQAEKLVGYRRNRVAEGLGKAITRRQQFMRQGN